MKRSDYDFLISADLLRPGSSILVLERPDLWPFPRQAAVFPLWCWANSHKLTNERRGRTSCRAAGDAVRCPQIDDHQERRNQPENLQPDSRGRRQPLTRSGRKQEVPSGLELFCRCLTRATHRRHHQGGNGATFHRSDDGGDEDQDGPDRVVKELLNTETLIIPLYKTFKSWHRINLQTFSDEIRSEPSEVKI